MSKELTENTWVYTENGIENVHWCNVNGVDELVSPKGKVLAPVPSYDEYKELKEERDYFQKTMFERNVDINELQEQLKEANEILKAYSTESLWESLSLSYDMAQDYLKKWGVK